MELYIVRHGIAEPQEGAQIDAERALTAQGRKKTLSAARGLLAIGCRPDRMLTSPLRRAAETARILADVLCPGVEVEACDALAPGADPAELVSGLGPGPAGAVMLVGHMPGVAVLASYLVCARGRVDLQFKKAATCCIAFEGAPARGGGTVSWLLQPRHLCMLGAEVDPDGDRGD